MATPLSWKIVLPGAKQAPTTTDASTAQPPTDPAAGLIGTPYTDQIINTPSQPDPGAGGAYTLPPNWTPLPVPPAGANYPTIGFDTTGAPPASAVASTPATSSADPTGGGSPSGPGPDAGIEAAYREALMSLLSPVTPDSVVNSPEMQAIRLQNQRSTEREQAGAAESLGEAGLSSSGSEDSIMRGIRQGESERNVTAAGSVAEEMRNRLLSAIGLGQGQEQFSTGTALNYAQLQQSANQNALQQLLVGLGL